MKRPFLREPRVTWPAFVLYYLLPGYSLQSRMTPMQRNGDEPVTPNGVSIMKRNCNRYRQRMVAIASTHRPTGNLTPARQLGISGTVTDPTMQFNLVLRRYTARSLHRHRTPIFLIAVPGTTSRAHSAERFLADRIIGARRICARIEGSRDLDDTIGMIGKNPVVGSRSFSLYR